MAKRIVTKIGDIFCVELGDGYKSYFQYIARDMAQLYSSVIRVFEGRYPLDYKPDFEKIVWTKVQFYAHTAPILGVEEGYWHKVGKSAEIGAEALKEVVFGGPSIIMAGLGPGDIMEGDPIENWEVGKLNQPRFDIGPLPDSLLDRIEYDGVLSYKKIFERMKYGYYKSSGGFYDKVKRKPWSWIDSYVVTANELTRESKYLHFHGNKVVRELVVNACGDCFRLTEENPADGPYRLFAGEFGDVNWTTFISEEEFNAMWNKKGK